MCKHQINTLECTQNKMILYFTVIASVVKSVCEFSHRMGDVIVFGYATSHAAPIEEGEGNIN